MTRLMVAYDGEVDVADDGTLIYRFEELLPSAETGRARTQERWAWSWDQPDPVPPLTGNTGGTDLAIGGFAGFNLLASLTIGPAFLQRFRLDDPWALFFVTVFPLIFSAIFFAVPAARWLVRQRRLKRRERRQLRRAMMREIWSAPQTPRDPDELAARVGQATGQPKEGARKLLEQLLREFDGDVTTDGDGRVRYTFPRLAEEQAAVRKARAEAPERRLGEVIFSSEDPEEPVRG
jgi:hypothetical protein